MMLTNSSSEISTNFLGSSKTDNSIFNNPPLETGRIKDSSTMTDDDKALSEFNKSIQLVNGRYQVLWPRREENPSLFNNYKLSYGRLASTVKRLKENPETMKQYKDIIEDQVNQGIIEKIDDNTAQGEIKHYKPHHGLIKPNNRTTKLRVVYDAPEKAKKKNAYTEDQ